MPSETSAQIFHWNDPLGGQGTPVRGPVGITVKLRCNKPLYTEHPGITNHILQRGTVEPGCNVLPWDWEKCFRYNGGSLYRGPFPYILLLQGWRISFVVPWSSLCRGSLYRGSTRLAHKSSSECFFSFGSAIAEPRNPKIPSARERELARRPTTGTGNEKRRTFEKV